MRIFIDVGTGGCTAEVLAERNSHNVGLETIEKMIKSYNSVGSFTIKRVMESKDRFKQTKFAFVELDTKSISRLLIRFNHLIPSGWSIHAHHMTVSFGKGLSPEQRADIGKSVDLKGIAIGISDKAIAIKVEGYPTTNDIPHITLGVSPDGKPVMSNNIINWEPLESHIGLSGIVGESAPVATPTTIKQ